MFERIIGVLTLKAPIYKEIAEDTNATSEAAMIFIVCTILNGFFTRLVVDGQFHIVRAVIGANWGVVIGMIGWVVTAWVLSFVTKALEGKTDFGEMLRVTGYVSVFSLIGVINIFSAFGALACITGLISFAVAILNLIGYLIGIREAAEFDTGKAIITAILAVIVNFLIVVVIGGLIFGGLVVLFAGAAAVTGGM